MYRNRLELVLNRKDWIYSCWCMTIRRCVAYCNDLHGTLTFDLKVCFRYLKLLSPLNAAICTTTYLERQKCCGLGKKILFKKQLFDLEVKVPRSCLGHNIFVFRGRTMIFGMWVHDHKVVCHVPL
jgi:hypothetical protein